MRSLRPYLVFLKLLPLPLLQGSPTLFGFKPLLLQPSSALLELLFPERLGFLLLLQPHCLLGRQVLGPLFSALFGKLVSLSCLLYI